VCRWVKGRDTLACGEPYTGRNPAEHVAERRCFDPDGRARSGHWRGGTTIRDPRLDANRTALGEWKVLEAAEKVPADEKANWEPVVQAANWTVAGVWSNPAFPQPSAAGLQGES
jgi:hypothetical protein